MKRVEHDIPPLVLIRSLSIVGFFLAAVWLLIQAIPVLTLLIVSILLAVALDPLVKKIEHLGLPRSVAIFGCVGIISLICVGISMLLFPPLVSQAQTLLEKTPGYIQELQDTHRYQSLLNEYPSMDKVEKSLENIPTFLIGQLTSIVGNIFTFIAATFTVFFLTVLLLLNGQSVAHVIVRLWPQLTTRRSWAVIQASYYNIGGYVRGNLILSLVAGLTLALFLALVGLPYVIALGVWMALLDIIPLVGASIGAIPAVIVAFAVGGMWQGIAVCTFIFIYQQIENGFLQPHIMGKIVELSPLMIFISVLIGAQILGVLGAVLAIPFAGIIQILLAEYIREQPGEVALPSIEDPPEQSASGKLE